jgi:hypothetical protein
VQAQRVKEVEARRPNMIDMHGFTQLKMIDVHDHVFMWSQANAGAAHGERRLEGLGPHAMHIGNGLQ